MGESARQQRMQLHAVKRTGLLVPWNLRQTCRKLAIALRSAPVPGIRHLRSTKGTQMKTLLTVLATLFAMFTGASMVQPVDQVPAQTQQVEEVKPQEDETTKQKADEAAQKAKARRFMRAKLAGSQSVLDGLVTEDFGLIHRGAKNMKLISEAVQWPRSEDKVYDHHGEEFRSQCDKLMDLADEKNLEGVHYTYLSMTTTCVDCHNYVRDKFRVVRDRTDPQGPMRLIPTEWDETTYR